LMNKKEKLSFVLHLHLIYENSLALIYIFLIHKSTLNYYGVMSGYN
jgi:hypothetical protein